MLTWLAAHGCLDRFSIYSRNRTCCCHHNLCTGSQEKANAASKLLQESSGLPRRCAVTHVREVQTARQLSFGDSSASKQPNVIKIVMSCIRTIPPHSDAPLLSQSHHIILMMIVMISQSLLHAKAPSPRHGDSLVPQLVSTCCMTIQSTVQVSTTFAHFYHQSHTWLGTGHPHGLTPHAHILYSPDGIDSELDSK